MSRISQMILATALGLYLKPTPKRRKSDVARSRDEILEMMREDINRGIMQGRRHDDMALEAEVKTLDRNPKQR